MIRCADTLIVRVSTVTQIVLCSLCIAAAAAEPPQAQGTPGAERTTPDAGAMAAVTPSPSADAACASSIKMLGAGDLAALESLPAGLAQHAVAANVFTCLAVAEANEQFCRALPDTTRATCVEQSQFLRELKGVPKGSMKAVVMEKLCLQEGSKEDCAKVRGAIAAQNASLCEGLSSADGIWSRNGLCPVLATSDPARCSGAPAGAPRATCEAMATDDPTRCPKDAKDCTDLVGNFAILKKSGVEGQGLDPVTAALGQGRKACQPLLAELQRACAGGAPPAAGSSD